MVDPVWTPQVSLGDWLAPRLQGWGDHVGTPVAAVVPGGFDAYARVLHPAGQDDDEDEDAPPGRWCVRPPGEWRTRGCSGTQSAVPATPGGR